MQEILIAVGLFSTIVIGLALLILAARKVLVPGGDVSIMVNGERDVVAQPGNKLLGALSASELFLPSACGGGGS